MAAGEPSDPPTQGAAAFRCLAAMAFLAPALGVPHDEMLQDSFKSMVVALLALLAAMTFFWSRRERAQAPLWHGVLWLPIGLAAYALASMAWSHPWLAGVESVRWMLIALIAWLALNTLSPLRIRQLYEGIHWGTVVAAVWAALQFWLDWSLFPQGRAPASSFANRNFFAEYAVCALPFSWLLVTQARRPGHVAALAASAGLIVLAVLMTGTRSALLALAGQGALALALLAWRAASPARRGPGLRTLAGGVFALVVGVGGLAPTGSPRIAEEGRGLTPLARAVQRGQSLGGADASMAMRLTMWRDTLRMIQAHPLAGVGAGAWENEIPRYQASTGQLETDYYAHNEALQLVAEYGLAGWAFFVALLAYLAGAAHRTWRLAARHEPDVAPRAAALASVASLLIVGNAGFPLHMAATGALFALCLGVLAYSDAQGQARPSVSPAGARWRPAWNLLGMCVMGLGLALAAHVSWRAAQVERALVQAEKLAAQMSQARAAGDARWEALRGQVVARTRSAIAIHPHYRRITPLIADELARAGDWADALWIWESVLSSRPNVVAIIANVGLAHAQLGDGSAAQAALARAHALAPDAPAVLSLQALLLARQRQDAPVLRP